MMKDRTIRILFWSTIITIFILLLWFILALIQAGFVNANKPLSPEISSNVGSFIGGVVGGILSFVTLFILYQTYKLQVSSANESKINIRDDKLIGSFDQLNLIHESIVNDISDLEFTDHEGQEHKGSIAIVYYEQKTQGPDIFIDKLNYIINSYKLLITECKRRIGSFHDVESVETAKAFLGRFYLSFYTKLLWLFILEEHINNGRVFKPFQVYQRIAREISNDDAQYIFLNFSAIGEEAFIYLNEHNLIATNNEWKKRSLEKIKSFKTPVINNNLNRAK